jgi:hypothetical protein
MARTKQPVRGTSKDGSSTKIEDEALAPTEQAASVEIEAAAEEEAPISSDDAAPVAIEAEAPAVVESHLAAADVEALPSAENDAPAPPVSSEAPLAPSLAAAADAPATSFTAIVAEATDYSRKSFDNGSAFVKKFLGAKSLENAIQIQSEYAKTSYADFVLYVTKISKLYSKLAAEVLERRSHIA